VTQKEFVICLHRFTKATNGVWFGLDYPSEIYYPKLVCWS